MDTTELEHPEQEELGPHGERVISLPPLPPLKDTVLISAEAVQAARQTRLGRPLKYPWDRWLRTDGYAVVVEHGVHFDCEVGSFYNIAHKTAIKRGYAGIKLHPLEDAEPCRLFALETVAKR